MMARSSQVSTMLPNLSAPYKQQLLTSKAQLLARLATLRGGLGGRAEASAEHFGHPEDSPAQLNTERDLEFALDEQDTAELRRIDAALSRIDDGSYGQCIDCGVSIPAARLHAAPEAARCISCQEKVE